MLHFYHIFLTIYFFAFLGKSAVGKLFSHFMIPFHIILDISSSPIISLTCHLAIYNHLHDGTIFFIGFLRIRRGESILTQKQIESEHEIEKVGAELRGLMSWMKKLLD